MMSVFKKMLSRPDYTEYTVCYKCKNPYVGPLEKFVIFLTRGAMSKNNNNSDIKSNIDSIDSKRLRKTFKRLADKEGRITSATLRDFARDLDLELSDADICEMIDVADATGTGAVSFTGLVDLVREFSQEFPNVNLAKEELMREITLLSKDDTKYSLGPRSCRPETQSQEDKEHLYTPAVSRLSARITDDEWAPSRISKWTELSVHTAHRNPTLSSPYQKVDGSMGEAAISRHFTSMTLDSKSKIREEGSILDDADSIQHIETDGASPCNRQSKRATPIATQNEAVSDVRACRKDKSRLTSSTPISQTYTRTTQAPSRLDSDVESRLDSNAESRANLHARKSRLDSNVESRLDSNVESRLDSNVESRLDLNVESRLDSNVESRLDSNVESRLGSNVESRAYLNAESRLDSNVESRLGSNVESRADSNVESRLGSNVESRLDSNVESRLGSNVESRLDSNVESRLDSNVESRLDSNVESRADLYADTSTRDSYVEHGRLIASRRSNGDPTNSYRSTQRQARESRTHSRSTEDESYSERQHSRITFIPDSDIDSCVATAVDMYTRQGKVSRQEKPLAKAKTKRSDNDSSLSNHQALRTKRGRRRKRTTSDNMPEIHDPRDTHEDSSTPMYYSTMGCAYKLSQLRVRQRLLYLMWRTVYDEASRKITTKKKGKNGSRKTKQSLHIG